MKTMNEMSHWLNVLILDTKFPNFFTFQPSANNNFGKNLKFHDFSMTQINVSNFHDFPRLGMQISNSTTYHDCVNPVKVVHTSTAIIGEDQITVRSVDSLIRRLPCKLHLPAPTMSSIVCTDSSLERIYSMSSSEAVQ